MSQDEIFANPDAVKAELGITVNLLHSVIAVLLWEKLNDGVGPLRAELIEKLGRDPYNFVLERKGWLTSTVTHPKRISSTRKARRELLGVAS